MSRQIEKIRKAYDLTVTQFKKGIDVYAAIPESIKEMPGYTEITAGQENNSNAADIKHYLAPRKGMRYLDAGCCANLVNYRFDKWPSLYYGVDISSALVDAMRGFVAQNNISIGGLHVGDISHMPFVDKFFDIASLIGVLQYCTLQHSRGILRELRRVLKPDARMVLDIPNLEYPYVDTMFTLERFLGRPNIPKERKDVEELLKDRFITDHVDDARVMVKYFVRVKR